MCGQVLHRHIAQVRLDVMLNTMEITGQKGISPVIQPIDLHVFIQKLTDRDELLLRAFGLYGRLFGRAKFTDGLLVFDLSDPQIRGFVGGKTFIYWFGIAGAAVADLIRLSFFPGSYKLALLVSCT